MTSLAPSRASVAAQAAPIPDAPPVTIATLPSTWPIASSNQQSDDNFRRWPARLCREERKEVVAARRRTVRLKVRIDLLSLERAPFQRRLALRDARRAAIC